MANEVQIKAKSANNQHNYGVTEAKPGPSGVFISSTRSVSFDGTINDQRLKYRFDDPNYYARGS